MMNIQTLTNELAKECREEGLNFIIAIEDGVIKSQHSVSGNTPLKEVVSVLKKIIK